MRSGATIRRIALAVVVCVAFAGLEKPAGAKVPEDPKQLVISFYESEAAAREAMKALKAAADRGEVNLEAHALLVKDANGKVKFKERRAKGTRGGQAVAAIGGALGARAGLGVGASATEAVEYLSSNVIAMPRDQITSLQVGFEPGEAALVSAVDARRAQTAATLQEAGAARVLTHNLPTSLPQPDGAKELPPPMQAPQLVPYP